MEVHEVVCPLCLVVIPVPEVEGSLDDTEAMMHVKMHRACICTWTGENKRDIRIDHRCRVHGLAPDVLWA